MKLNRQTINMFIILSVAAVGFVYQNCARNFSPQSFADISTAVNGVESPRTLPSPKPSLEPRREPIKAI